MHYIGPVWTRPICTVVSSKVFPGSVILVVFISFFFFNNFGNLHSVEMLNLVLYFKFCLILVLFLIF